MRVKNNIFKSLGGSGVRELQRLGIYNLPFSDISQTFLAFF
jgi:hypothetical protein